MQTISLNGTWQLRGRLQEGEPAGELSAEATVPGCVLLDLSRQGYLPEDLYMGENILQTHAYEGYEWWYSRSFTAPKERENAYLVFEGVDCIARYYLNGVYLGESKNMMISHEFSVGQLLQERENTLTVHIQSPVIAAHYENYTVAAMMTWENAPVETGVRRAPHTNGWDIMPRAITSGIWRDVKLELRDPIRFSQLFFKTTDKTCTLLYEVDCKWSDFKDIEIEAEGWCGDSIFSARTVLRTGKAGRIELPMPGMKRHCRFTAAAAAIWERVFPSSSIC